MIGGYVRVDPTKSPWIDSKANRRLAYVFQQDLTPPHKALKTQRLQLDIHSKKSKATDLDRNHLVEPGRSVKTAAVEIDVYR
ncbi:hypothetical protein ACTXT7_011654 [Hymenolepis weldensis]